MTTITVFDSWGKAKAELAEAKGWLAHIGAQGRGGDILRVSPGHCKAPKIMVAGQYTTGGNNYWESPQKFNDRLLDVIIGRLPELARETIARMEQDVARALVATEAEVAKMSAEIEKAKAGLPSEDAP